MKIISTSSRGNFIYERDEKKILELVHPKWFSKKAITKYNNKNIKIDKDTGLTLLFSDKAPTSRELQKVKLDLSIEDRCD